LASNFFAVQGMMETITRSLFATPSSAGKSSLTSAPSICCGDLQVDKFGSNSGKYCSANFTQPGQQLVNSGSFPPLVLRPKNSFASSITVKSALNAVS
jgi:hypothetical protein